MGGDSLYQDILERLNGDLDEDAFQRCAQDLLRDAYPSLVPMAGVDDAGMDGAVGGAEGAFPLVCTIDRRGPLTNFRKNITTFLAKRQGPKRAVIATPRKVSNLQRRNLEDFAERDYGVRIVNVHEQSDFANRLYRHAEWRRELLGLSGRPPALSALPPRSRPEQPPLIGRDDELAWMRKQTGDLLLVGQPGVGKTYLHQALVADGTALFAVDQDAERLADALRRQAPRAIIIDDAHESPELIRLLRRLRRQFELKFALHANCWPHAEARIRAEMELPDTAVRQLAFLTRDQVVELMKGLGLHGPDGLLSLLLDQAEGKPGLAAALVAAVKRGDVDRVWNGETVAELLLHGRQLISSFHDQAVLAGISLGGSLGMTADEVADGLGMASLEVRRVVTNLAAGGVVEEVARRFDSADHKVAVRPQVLRGLLVRDAFFRGPAPVNPNPLIALARLDPYRKADLAHTLMAARQRGANVAHELLVNLTVESGSPDVWRHLAYVDEAAADLILSRFREHVSEAAEGLLYYRPDATLHELLLAAESCVSQQKPDDPRRRINEWIEGDKPGDPDSVPRRRRLLNALNTAAGKLDRPLAEVHDWALAAVLAPNIAATRTSPGSGMRVVVYRGIRSVDQLREIAQLWPEVLRLLGNARRLTPEFRQVVEGWCLPQRHAMASLPPEVHAFMEEVAQKILNDLIELPACGRAARSWIKTLARSAHLNMSVRVDQTFDRVFRRRYAKAGWETQHKRRQVVLRAVGDEMLALGPNLGVRELVSLEREARDFRFDGGWERQIMYWHIAQNANDPVAWIHAALEHKLPADQVGPFVEVAIQKIPEDLESLLMTMLAAADYQNLARKIVSIMPEPTSQLIDAALADWELDVDVLMQPQMRSPPAEPLMRRLLRHPHPNVRVSAALVEWRTDPKAHVRPSLHVDWRSAILEARRDDDHFLQEALFSDLDLSFEWAARKVDESKHDRDDPRPLWEIDHLFSSVVSRLSTEQRWLLLEQIDVESYDPEAFGGLLQEDLEMFRKWLRRHLPAGERSRYYALQVLDRKPDEIWERLALVALDEGVLPDELAEHALPRSAHMSSPFSNYYAGLIPDYERLANHPDRRLHLAGHKGLEWARRNAESERQCERLAAVRGR